MWHVYTQRYTLIFHMEISGYMVIYGLEMVLTLIFTFKSYQMQTLVFIVVYQTKSSCMNACIPFFKHCRAVSSTCMVQIVLQPTLGALVVKLPPTRHEEQQVVPEHTTWFTNESNLQGNSSEGKWWRRIRGTGMYRHTDYSWNWWILGFLRNLKIDEPNE